MLFSIGLELIWSSINFWSSVRAAVSSFSIVSWAASGSVSVCVGG